MMTRLLLVSGTLGALVMAQPQSANAGVDVDVSVTTYPPYSSAQYYPDSGYPSYQHDYDEDDDYDDDRISCWEGRRIVRNAGYRRVKTMKCHGEVYRYRGWRRGHQWRVSVDADTGRIIRARPIDYSY
jgi:hypothetical protein